MIDLASSKLTFLNFFLKYSSISSQIAPSLADPGDLAMATIKAPTARRFESCTSFGDTEDKLIDDSERAAKFLLKVCARIGLPPLL